MDLVLQWEPSEEALWIPQQSHQAASGVCSRNLTAVLPESELRYSLSVAVRLTQTFSTTSARTHVRVVGKPGWGMLGRRLQGRSLGGTGQTPGDTSDCTQLNCPNREATTAFSW